jgi:hypothetical protein
VPGALGLEEAAVAGVGHERLVALLELAREAVEDGGALGRVRLGLLVVDADDVTLLAHPHRLGGVIGLRVALGEGERYERRGIREHDLAHQLVGALAGAEDIEEVARLEPSNGLGADHAAVGDDADAADREPPLQPIDHRKQACDIGGVARPHLRAHRTPVAVDQHSQDHLL